MSTAKRRSDRATVLEALARAGRAHSEATVIFHASVADRLGLNPTDAKVMSLLQRRGPVAAGEIAGCTGLTTASVTALVDRLARRDFVRRLPDPADRRRVLVDVTDQGRAHFERLLRSTARSLAELYDAYTVAQLEVVLDFLTRNAERLRDETARLPGSPA
jgi:DNA-binding MarR family transcriptional regulator